MAKLVDIHTHRPLDETFRTISTAGIHPYDVDTADDSTLEAIERVADDVDAIGEIGLDGVCSSDFDKQEQIFRKQLFIAQHHKKGVVIHAVRAFEKVMKILEEHTLPFVIFHGFIGSVEQARQAVNRGYFLSFGERTFHSSKTIKALQETPLDHIFVESDTSRMPLEEIYAKIAEILSTEPHKLAKQIDENFEQLFSDC